MQYTDLQQYQQQQQAIKDLQKYHDPEHLWSAFLLFRDMNFRQFPGSVYLSVEEGEKWRADERIMD